MRIPFIKAHGAKNDFLLTWERDVPDVALPAVDLPDLARAICDRNTGVGADGWIIVDPRPGIRLFNSDGSEPELSGNGTRCAAAFFLSFGDVKEPLVIATGAGPKSLSLISRRDNEFEFQMNMGRPRMIDAHYTLALSSGPRDVTLVDCGNPQCVVPVDDFDFDWPSMGREIEGHAVFPNRTNVSFIRETGEHSVEARFYERGAGVTMSSGTGSTGAAACAIVRGIATSPVRVETPAGPLELTDHGGELFLKGPAVLVAEGVFFAQEDNR